MVKINLKNVAKLLFDDISAKYTKVTPINAKEIELKDQLLGKKCILFIVYQAHLNLPNSKSKFLLPFREKVKI